MNQTINRDKKKYISPQMRVYDSLKNITADDTCYCFTVKCPVYCQETYYPPNGNYCPRKLTYP
jgi:hypothetical protein